MRKRVLVVGFDAVRSRALAEALRGRGFAPLEAISSEEIEGLGFAAAVAVGEGPWFARLRAAGHPGARIGLSADLGALRHADAVLPLEADAESVCRAVEASVPRLEGGQWQVGEEVIDLTRQRIGEHEIGTQETALLAALLAADGETVSTERLLRDAWGTTGARITRAVDHAAHRLRQVLEPEPAQPRYLLTVRGVGLRLAGARKREETTGPGGSDGWPLDPAAEGLSRVAAMLDAATASDRRVALVGPAGTGKSVLARAWARARGWRWRPARQPADTERGPLLIDDLDRQEVIAPDAVLVTARQVVAGFTTVYLPDRTDDLPAIASHTARYLGQAPPDSSVLDALVSRIGPNALGVVRFVERSAWIDPQTLLQRLDQGKIDVLGDPSARDPRHYSLAHALEPEIARLPPPMFDALRRLSAEPRAALEPEIARHLVETGLASRSESGLRLWPALAAWIARR